MLEVAVGKGCIEFVSMNMINFIKICWVSFRDSNWNEFANKSFYTSVVASPLAILRWRRQRNDNKNTKLEETILMGQKLLPLEREKSKTIRAIKSRIINVLLLFAIVVGEKLFYSSSSSSNRWSCEINFSESGRRATVSIARSHC